MGIAVLSTQQNPNTESYSDTITRLEQKRNKTYSEVLELQKAKKFYGKFVEGKTKSKDISKAVQYEQYIRGEIGRDFSGNEVDVSTVEQYRPFYKIQEYEKAVKTKQFLPRAKFQKTAVTFEHKGPGNGYAYGSKRGYKFSGRAISFAIHPTNDKIWYVGTAGGGVYKTENEGELWTYASKNITNLAVPVIAISKSDPNTLYCGTGDTFASSNKGDGLFISKDAGKTWTSIKASQTVDFVHPTGIHVSPSDSKSLLVSTKTGVFYSSDAGNSFKKASGIKGFVTSLVVNPKNAKSFYASVQADGVYSSKDGGKTFSKVYDASSFAKRMTLATTPADTSFVYGLAENSGNGFSDFFKTVDAGKTWKKLTQTGAAQNIFQTGGANQPGGQGWYDQSISVHPYDATKFYVGGIDIYYATSAKSEDKVTLERRSEGYKFDDAIKYCHVDQHGMTVLPKGNNKFYILFANDGGVALSKDEAKTFLQKTKGLDNIQLYSASKHPTKQRYFGGSQDNGSPLSPENPTATTTYDEQIGGDGFGTVWHSTDPKKLIGSIYNATFAISKDEGASFQQLAFAGAGQGNFISQVAYSAVAPNMLVIPAASKVFVSYDFGDKWTAAELGRSNGFGGGLYAGSAISEKDAKVVWAADQVQAGVTGPFLSTDAGGSFKELKTIPSAFDKATPISGIATHPTERNTAFLLFSYSGKPHVLRTKDLGQTWEDLSGSGSNFPNVATYSLQVMPHDTKEIWAGTEIGLFVSKDEGKTWAIEEKVPPVAIREMKIVKDHVVMGTYGRGIYAAKIPEFKPDPTVFTPSLSVSAHPMLNNINVNIKVITAVDSIQITKRFSGASEVKTVKNLAKGNYTYSYAYTKAGEYSFQIKSFIKDKNYVSDEKKVSVTIRTTKIEESYSTTFDDGKDSKFDLSGFTVKKEDGFDSKLLNTEHPYKLNTVYSATLKLPIKVTNVDTFMTFQEVVLVNDYYNGTQYDAVYVEASKDLNKWVELAKYDALKHKEWETESKKNENAKGTKALLKEHVISIPSGTFKKDDVIFVRFRLPSDQEVIGWGWAIEDLYIQKTKKADPVDPVEPPKPAKIDLNFTFAQNPQFNKQAYLFVNADQKLQAISGKHALNGGNAKDISFTLFHKDSNIYLNKDLRVEKNSKNTFYTEVKGFDKDGKPLDKVQKDTLEVNTYRNKSLELRQMRVSGLSEQTLVGEYVSKRYNKARTLIVGYENKKAERPFKVEFDVPFIQRDFAHVYKFEDGKWKSVPAYKSDQGVFVETNEYGTYALDIKSSKNQSLNEKMTFELSQNYPNPFNPTTTISFKIADKSAVSLMVYNALGQHVKTLVHGYLPAGTHHSVWNGKNTSGMQVSSGIYFYKLVTPNKVFTKKMVLLK